MTGWQCPGCSAYYGSHVARCFICGANILGAVGTSTMVIRNECCPSCRRQRSEPPSTGCRQPFDHERQTISGWSR